MKIEEVILGEDQKVQLDIMLEQYQQVSDEYTAIEAKKKALNAVIKNLFEEYGIKKYSSESGISASVTVKHNVEFDPDKLLDFCRGLNEDGLIKTAEYVDMDVLERCMYADKTLKERLKPTQVVKPDTITLRCSKKKTLNE